MRRNMNGNLGLYKYLWPGSVCTRGIMVSSLGFEANVLGSNPNSGYLSFSSISDNCYFSKHKF